MRRIGCLFVLFVLMLSTAGCTAYEGPYTFWRQDRSHIEKVEICSYNSFDKTQTVITTLSDTAEALLDEISSLECLEYFPGDHPREYGPFVVCITYSDGEMELIGFTNIGYIKPDGVRCLTEYFIADSQEFFDVICKYVESDLVQDMNEEYSDWFY